MKNPNTADHVFNSIQRVYDADGDLISRTSGPNIGTRPLDIQFTGLGVVWNAVTDRIEVSVLGGGFVPSSLTFNATLPLRVNGGASADLSGDQTWALQLDNTSIVVNGSSNLAVGIISAAQHDNQTSGSLHALAVPGSPGTAGFLSGVFAQDLTNATATSIGAGTLVKRGASGEVVGAWFQGDVSLTTATAGLLRMRPTDTIVIRNNANSANITAVSRSGAGDVLSFGVENAGVITIGPNPAAPTTPPLALYFNSSGATYFYDDADERLGVETDANGPMIRFADTLGAVGTIKTTGTQSLFLDTNALTVSCQGGEPLRVTSDTEVTIGPNTTLGAQSGDPDTYQGGFGVVWFPVATVEPTAAPTTGMYMWYFGGNLKAWKAGAGAPVNII